MGFRRYGHYKDRRSGLPQVVISDGGHPGRYRREIRVGCWPGNTTDVTLMAQTLSGSAGLEAEQGG